MHETLERAVALVKAVVGATRRRDASFLAAAVAYYAFVSLIPLSLLGYAAATTVGGDFLAGPLHQAVDGLLAEEGRAVLDTVLTAQEGRGGASVVGTLVLAWSSSRLLRGIDRAFAQVYDPTERETLPQQLRDAVVVAGAVIAGFVAMAGVGAVVALLPVGSTISGLGVLGLWLTLGVALLPVYTVLPDVEVGPREALPGALLAATTFVLLGSLFGAYTAIAGDFAVYGVLGAVLVLVTWLYLGSLLVVIGAVLNAVLAGRITGYRERPDPPAE